MKILIVKLAALGDVLRTTALLGPLRGRYPGARIWWLTTAKAAPLLASNPWIERVVSMEDAAGRGLGSDFDLVLSLEEDAAAAALARGACRGELVGIFPEGGRLRYTASSALYYDMSLLNRDASGGLAAANALKAENRLTYAQLWVKILGLDAGTDVLRPVLVLTDSDRQVELPASGTLVGLNPGAGARWPAKQLSVEKAAEVLAALEPLGVAPVIFGGKDEAERNAAIFKRVPRAVDPGTALGLRAFAAAIELCRVVITTDSLAFHISAALGKGTVVLVGPTSAAELDGGSRCTKLVWSQGCSCFYRSHCRLEKSCIDEIPAPEIVGAVRRWLA